MSTPWNDYLPKAVEIGGEQYEIRSDYRAILDILTALDDPELRDNDRFFVALTIFYPSFDEIQQGQYQCAVEKLFWFINGGVVEEKRPKSPKLVDWEQDFTYIIAPVNKVLGREIRDVDYLHWWTFLSAYQEIGDCTFAQIVRIRDLKSRGKALDKQDREWYRRNQHLVDIKSKYTDSDKSLLQEWGGV